MSLIEKRYAEALVKIAVQNDSLELYLQNFADIVDLFKSRPDLMEFFQNPATDINAKKDAFNKIFKSSVDEKVLNFHMILLDKKRFEKIIGIFEEFVKLADENKNVLNITIVSASTLEQEQLDKLTEKYRTLYNVSSIKVTVKIDETLIGGIKVIIGDKLIDGTIKGRLQELKKTLVG